MCLPLDADGVDGRDGNPGEGCRGSVMWPEAWTGGLAGWVRAVAAAPNFWPFP